MKERFIGLNWQMPVRWNKRHKLNDDSLQLYQIYGRHPVYGADVLLYIGMSEVISGRLNSHDSNWVQWLPDSSTVTAACLMEFTEWEHYNDPKYDDDYFPPASREIVKVAESLLIYGHQPVYNTKHRKKLSDAARGFRIFNTGFYRSLESELSYFGLTAE